MTNIIAPQSQANLQYLQIASNAQPQSHTHNQGFNHVAHAHSTSALLQQVHVHNVQYANEQEQIASQRHNERSKDKIQRIQISRAENREHRDATAATIRAETAKTARLIRQKRHTNASFPLPLGPRASRFVVHVSHGAPIHPRKNGWSHLPQKPFAIVAVCHSSHLPCSVNVRSKFVLIISLFSFVLMLSNLL
jgi:hypothetical protein